MGDLDSKVASTKQTLDQLIQKRNAVDPSMPLDQLERLTTEIRSHEKRLEDLQLLHIAIEKKLRQYDGNRSKGVKLREEAVGLDNERRALVEKVIIPAQRNVGPALMRIETINAEIRAKAEKHLELTGQNMNEPPPILLYQAHAFAGPGVEGFKAGVEIIKLPEPWVYRSDDELQEQRTKDEAEKKVAFEECAKKAQDGAPHCSRCAGETQLDRTMSPMTRGDGASWYFRCKKCGNSDAKFIPGTRPPGR